MTDILDMLDMAGDLWEILIGDWLWPICSILIILYIVRIGAALSQTLPAWLNKVRGR